MERGKERTAWASGGMRGSRFFDARRRLHAPPPRQQQAKKVAAAAASSPTREHAGTAPEGAQAVRTTRAACAVPPPPRRQRALGTPHWGEDIPYSALKGHMAAPGRPGRGCSRMPYSRATRRAAPPHPKPPPP